MLIHSTLIFQCLTFFKKNLGAFSDNERAPPAIRITGFDLEDISGVSVFVFFLPIGDDWQEQNLKAVVLLSEPINTGPHESYFIATLYNTL